MGQVKRKLVLFLDTEPGEHGRLAAAEFDAVAARLGLPFEAVCQNAGPFPGAAAVVVVSADCHTVPENAERWDIPATDAPAAVRREVAGLVARLLGGRTVTEAELPKPAVKEPPKKVHTVRVGRETAGRRGKGVTTVFELPLGEEAVKELAATLKQKCGTGGTVKDGKIEIQGDHRDRIVAELEKLGYKVKRTGG